MRNSKLLLKLVDRAILPAVFLFAAKVIGTFFVATYIGADSFNGLVAFNGLTASEYIFVNSYSTIFVFVSIFLGMSYLLFKAHVTHETHISPYTSARIASMRLNNMVQTSFDLFSEASIWLMYSWLLTLVSMAQVALGAMYFWVAVVAFIFSVISSILVIIDVEREFRDENNNDNSNGNELLTTTYLEFREIEE